MDTFVAFLIGFAVTLFFVRGYLRKLTRGKKQPAAAAPVPVKPCPRCSKPVAVNASFCAACGAALAMWNVHLASEQSGPQDPAAGKPRPAINASLCIGCGSCVDACPETGTLALAGGKAILANPDRCVGHARCVEVCPTSAVSLARGNVLQTLRVPRVKENFETNLDGIFIVGELGGMGLIKTAINEGRLVMDHVRARLEQAGLWAPSPDGHPRAAANSNGAPYDVIIVGAGPAGLSASLTAQQAGIRYLTLEQGEVASTIRNYPRHKFLMAEPIEMPLYGTLYVGDGTKESLLSVWESIIANTGVRVQTRQRVESIRRKEDGVFAVESAGATHLGRHVILALGKRGTPRQLGVPGEESSKVAYRLIEADDYLDKDILVVGGGDSALEAAFAVSKAGRNRVTLSYRGDTFQRARERNQTMLAERESQGLVRVLRNSRVAEIRPDTVLLEVSGEPLEVPNQFVFILIGGQSPEDFLRKTGVEIVEKVITA